MKISRRKSRVIKIGDLHIGGNYPIAIQSMVKCKTSDTEKTIGQIKRLKEAGCEIVRLAVKDSPDARALKRIKEKSGLPLVADIHFDWRLAIKAIDSGADKIRLNPGNIYKKEQVREIVKAAKLARIPIRVGVNSGSLLKVPAAGGSAFGGTKSPPQAGPPSAEQSRKVRGIPQAMVRSALDYIRIVEESGFYDIVVSLKGSGIFDTIEAYRLMSGQCDYPLHLGVTATGAPYSGVIKSDIALSVLLLEGIGDTIRVSLTDKPEAEVKAAKSILEALGLRTFGPEIISCPTCGRCEVDLVKIVKDLENKLISRGPLTAAPIKVAVMGCIVNGPGEAKVADVGVAFGKKEGLLFKNGKPIRKIPYYRCVDALLDEILTG